MQTQPRKPRFLQDVTAKAEVSSVHFGAAPSAPERALLPASPPSAPVVAIFGAAPASDATPNSTAAHAPSHAQLHEAHPAIDPALLSTFPSPVTAMPEVTPPTPAADPGVDRFAAAVKMLRLQSERLAEQARTDVLEIAFQIARRILETELKTAPDTLEVLIRTAIRKAGESRRIVLRVSNEDAKAVESLRKKSDSELAVATIELLIDPTLKHGDCVVETDFGTVDGKLDTRLNELKRALDTELSGDQA